MSKTDPSPQPGKKAPEPLPRRAWINFLLIVVLWFGVVLWSWFFTDLRLEPLLGALGGLGLLVAPLWLLDKLPQLAAGVERALRRFLSRVLASRITFAALLGLLLAGAGASFGTGAVQLRSALEREIPVELRRDGAGEAGQNTSLTLPAGDRVRRSLWVGLGGGAEVTVEAVGFPPTTVTVRPWRIPTVRIPGDLRRTAVLLHPSAELSDFATSLAMELEVALPGEEEPRRMTFDGHPVWIGCTAECPVPELLLQKWRRSYENRPALLERLTRPRSLTGDLPHLDKDDRLEVTVIVHQERPLARHSVTVEGVSNQTEELHVQL